MKLSTISGVVVLATGLIAIGMTPHQSQPVDQGVSALPRDNLFEVDVATPDLEGVPPEVQRTLEASGKLQTLDPGSIEELPPEIARVLAYYEATLAIATPKEPDA